MKKMIWALAALVIVVFGVSYFASKDNSSQTKSNDSAETQPATNASNNQKVDLSGQQLTAIPASILSRTDITELNLSNNQIVILPAELGKMKNLQILNIENNRLEAFPPEIAELTSLREIRANNNRMTSLEDKLNSMTWLRSIDVSGNSIPSDIIDQLRSNLSNTEIKS